jgi:hypothetical protein
MYMYYIQGTMYLMRLGVFLGMSVHTEGILVEHWQPPHQGVLNDLKKAVLSRRLPPPSHIIKLSFFISLPVCRRSSLLTEERGGAKSFDGKKA